MAIHHLPPEIWTDILLRLPIKTLSIAKLVSNFWLHLISSSDFATAHLKSSKKDETLSDHRIIFATTSSDLLLKQFSVESLFCDSSSINLVDFGYTERVRLVGSCNGLVCVASSASQVTVLNPCTGKYNKLRPLDGVGLSVNYGFGYDEPNDDYKGVAVCVYSWGVSDCVSRVKSAVHVYSLKSNSWKRIHDFETGALDFCQGKLVSGKVHWFTNLSFDKRRQIRIASFDVTSEVFGVVELPIPAYELTVTTLDVLYGSICLLSDEGSHAELWVMKEYGEKDSWTKVVTISYFNVICYLYPWYVFPNGEILFRTNRSCAVYNPKDVSFKFLHAGKWDYESEPLDYVPSLVSPVGT